MAVPNVSYKVEIAWTSTFRTAAASRVWTDVSTYAELHEGMGVTYGRSDEISVADANQFNVTFDNKDGRFTPGNASSPYYPNVKIGKPIRLTATISGVDYVRFMGYVNEWPVEWPGSSDKYATAAITASSRLSRLGLDSPLATTVDQAIESTSPVGYWPLTEAVGATEGQNTLDASAPLRVIKATVAFGEGTEDPALGLGIDGRGCVLLSSPEEHLIYGGTLAATLPTPVPISIVTPGTGASIAVFLKTRTPFSGLVVPEGPILSLSDGTSDALAIRYDRVDGPSSASVTFPSYITADDELRCVIATLSVDSVTDEETLSVYVNGSLVGTSTNFGASFSLTTLTLNWVGNDSGPGIGVSEILAGRVAAWDRALTAAEAAAIAAAGLTAYSGDTTDDRLERYAGWARIPAAEVTTTASPVTMAAVASEDAQIVSLMREVETTEAGVLYDNRVGNLVLKPRSARYGAAVALTLNASLQDFDNYAPKVDRQGLANVGRGTNTLGTVDVTYTDEASREDYGDAACDVQTAALSPDEPLQLIAWQVKANAEPRPRTPAVTVNVIDWLATPTALLGLDIGSKVRISNAPAQAPAATSDYFVEGYAETFGVSTWSMALNLSPVAPYDVVFILDDATYGVLDTYTTLAI